MSELARIEDTAEALAYALRRSPLRVGGRRLDQLIFPAELMNLAQTIVTRLKETAHGQSVRLAVCEECGVNRADPPSKLCPGCEAYQEHQR